MTRQKFWFKMYLFSLLFLLLNLTSFSFANESEASKALRNDTGASTNTSSSISLPTDTASSSTPTSEPTSTKSPLTVTTAATLLAAATSQVEQEHPPTIPHFIHKMMIRFGEAKAAEALQSLDQLPLGLVMKILLVEMDKDLAADIVAMQRYAQGTDKTLIMLIGRIVGQKNEKNLSKDIFQMDQKLIKFPWWVRMRARMLNNLEKYIAAYTLVPVAAKTAVNGASKSVFDGSVGGLNSDLVAAVAASATESSNKIIKQVAAAVAPTNNNTPNNANNADLESLKVSLLNPILQQQQLLGTLALAKAASASNAQAQQLLLQAQQASNVNPFLLLGK